MVSFRAHLRLGFEQDTSTAKVTSSSAGCSKPRVHILDADKPLGWKPGQLRLSPRIPRVSSSAEVRRFSAGRKAFPGMFGYVWPWIVCTDSRTDMRTHSLPSHQGISGGKDGFSWREKLRFELVLPPAAFRC